jgi:hypothetical protein
MFSSLWFVRQIAMVVFVLAFDRARVGLLASEKIQSVRHVDAPEWVWLKVAISLKMRAKRLNSH